MPVRKARIARTAMAVPERRWRSQLAQIVAGHGLLRGTLQERWRVCGKSYCRCTRGHRHRGLYLVWSQEGHQQRLYVPKQWEATVRQWVENYHDIRELMEQLSQHHLKQVRQRQG